MPLCNGRLFLRTFTIVDAFRPPIRVRASSFGLAKRFVVVARQRRTGCCYEFGAAAFDEIAGLRNYALENFENLAYTSFPVDEFRKRCEWRFLALDSLGRAQRPCRGILFLTPKCHMNMLRLFKTESKGGLRPRTPASP